MDRDYYEVLGVARNATEAEIKKAYRRQAMQFHPDRNDGDKRSEEQFKEATEAYEVLREPQKRAQYDRFGRAGLGGASGGYGGFHPFDLSEALSVFMRDFGGMGGFDAFFGGGERAKRSRRRGQDLRVTLNLSLEDVAKGTTRKLKLKGLEACEECGGSGAKSGTAPVVCPMCRGSGEARRTSQSIFGQFISVGPCPQCNAEGTVVQDPCERCRGDGRVRKERVVEIEVPPGVSGNNYVTLRGQGGPGPRNGPPGDLVAEFRIQDDPRFVRRGDDLVHELLLSFSQAALGGEFTVPTPYGDETVTVPSGTQGGAVLDLRGMGLPSVADGRKGSLFVHCRVWTPTKLTPELKRVLKKLAEHEGEPPSDESLGRRMWDKVREAFGGAG